MIFIIHVEVVGASLRASDCILIMEKKCNKMPSSTFLLPRASDAASLKFKQHCPVLGKIAQRAENCLQGYSLDVH